MKTTEEQLKEMTKNALLLYEALKAFDHYLAASYPHNMKLKKYAVDLMEKALAKVDAKR